MRVKREVVVNGVYETPPPRKGFRLPLARVGCSECGAGPGTQCTANTGKPRVGGHKARRHAAAQLHAQERGDA